MNVVSAFLHRMVKRLGGIPYFLADHDLFPIRKDRICFLSRPDYGDNARVLFDYMMDHGYDRSYEFIWLVEHPEAYPDGIRGCRVYKVNSVGGALKELSSAWVFATHRFLHVSPHRKGQRCIFLGHGCGYKGDAPTTKKMFDQYLVISPLWKDVYARTFHCDRDRFLPLGYPRYDLMLHPTRDVTADFRALVGAKEGEKIVLWMPTFRVTSGRDFPEAKIQYTYPLPGLKSAQELETLNQVCREANVILVIKRHILQVEWNVSDLSHVRFLSNEDLETAGIQLYETLACTDALVSDYSSVSIDYMLLDKPQGFVLDDFDQYQDARGYNLADPLRYMPGAHIMDLADFSEFVRSVAGGEDPCAEDRARCRKELLREDVPASYCEDILKHFHLSAK